LNARVGVRLNGGDFIHVMLLPPLASSTSEEVEHAEDVELADDLPVHISQNRQGPNKSRQLNRRDAGGLDGFHRLGILWFIHDLSCRSPAVSAL
jgi:hypothetical protein